MSFVKLAVEENKIFSEYRRLNPGKAILPDGVADPIQYLAPSNFRTLFVLKEGNDPEGEWTLNHEGDLRNHARSGGNFRTWHNLATWVALANNQTVTVENRRDSEWRAEQLQRSAFINVKKVPGGSRSVTSEVVAFALNPKHASLLRQQIELYDARVILACGNGIFSVLESVLAGHSESPKEQGEMFEDGFWFFTTDRGNIVIDFYHPEAHLLGGWKTSARMLLANLRYHFPERYET